MRILDEESMMANDIDKKLWPFFILNILEKHASEGEVRNNEGERFLTQKQVVDFLESDYGIKTQRKAVRDNLVRLRDAGDEFPELGYSIETLTDERCAPSDEGAEGKQLMYTGWRLVKGYDFDTSEVRMLVDAVSASSVIPPKQASQLVRRLLELSSEPIVAPNIVREGHSPLVNNEFFLNLELLNEAIQEGRRVRFVLGAFAQDGKLHRESSDGKIYRYDVTPVQLLISKGHYYLLASPRSSHEIIKFRIELMLDVEKLGKAGTDAADANVNIPRFREQHSYMMSGKVMKVVLRIGKDHLLALYDQFGPNVHFKNEMEETVDAEIKSALYSVLFWALQYYRYVEVVEPPELREMLEVAGRVITNMYSGEPGTVGLGDRQTDGVPSKK